MNCINDSLFSHSFITLAIIGLLVSCGLKDSQKDTSLSDRLTEIEERIFLDIENLDSLLIGIDTTNLSPIAAARINTIKGLAQYNKEEYRNCISSLEKAEFVFIDAQDEYHIHINRLIKAFAFELLQLEGIAIETYIECDTYFSTNGFTSLRFYSSLGLLRYSKLIGIDGEELKKRIQEDSEKLKDPIYDGLFYATLAFIEKDQTLQIDYTQRAIESFSKGDYWAKVYKWELNLLYKMMEKDHSEKMQKYYDQFPTKKYSHTPTLNERLRYKFAQAFLYIRQKKFDDAIKIAIEVLNEADKANDSRVKNECLQNLVFLYVKTGNYKKAFEMREKFLMLESKRVNELKRNQLFALGAHYKFSELEKDKSNLKLKVQRSILIIIVVSFLLLSLVILGWQLLQRDKRTREKLQKEKMEIQGQIDNLLSSFRKSESDNKQLINQMEDVKSRYNKSIRISEFLSSVENREIKNWMEFEVHFSVLLPGWMESLKQKAPGLTPTDIRYCMCIYFNLSNYVISDLCNVSNDAIKSAKKRIRDKLLLADATEIYLFLKAIE